MTFNENHFFRAKTAMISVITEYEFSDSQSWNSYYQSWEYVVFIEKYWTSPNTYEILLILLKMSENRWTPMEIS